jgi:hypothetical protein
LVETFDIVPLNASLPFVSLFGTLPVLPGLGAYQDDDADDDAPTAVGLGVRPSKHADDVPMDLEEEADGVDRVATIAATATEEEEDSVDEDEVKAQAAEARLLARRQKRQHAASREPRQLTPPPPQATLDEAVAKKVVVPAGTFAVPKPIPKAKLDKDFAAWTKHEAGYVATHHTHPSARFVSFSASVFGWLVFFFIYI